jgi:hypothetical protein
MNNIKLSVDIIENITETTKIWLPLVYESDLDYIHDNEAAFRKYLNLDPKSFTEDDCDFFIEDIKIIEDNTLSNHIDILRYDKNVDYKKYFSKKNVLKIKPSLVEIKYSFDSKLDLEYVCIEINDNLTTEIGCYSNSFEHPDDNFKQKVENYFNTVENKKKILSSLKFSSAKISKIIDGTIISWNYNPKKKKKAFKIVKCPLKKLNKKK